MGNFGATESQEIAQLLNSTAGDVLSGRFVAAYQNYLASLSDIKSLTAALEALKSAPYKNYLLQHVFEKSPLVTPDNLQALLHVCKNKEEIEQLAIGLENKLNSMALEDRPPFAQAIVDKDVGGLVSARVIKVAVTDLADKDPGRLEKWLLDLPPEIALKGDNVLLTRYAATDTDKAINYINTLVALGQDARTRNAVNAFGLS